MKSIYQNFKIHEIVYLLLLIALLSGYIKNALLILLIVLCHEMGHILLCCLFKYEISRVVIYPFGGITKVNKLINSSINKELLIVSGGIISQCLLYLVMAYCWKMSLINSGTWLMFNTYNKSIMFFNMLPIIPLDGSLFIKLILEKFLSYKMAYRWYLIIGIVSISIFIFKSREILINNLMVLSFLVFKILEALKNYPFIYQKFLLERYLYDIDYKRIKYEEDFNKLGKERFYFFRREGKVVSEKKFLANLFDRKR